MNIQKRLCRIGILALASTVSTNSQRHLVKALHILRIRALVGSASTNTY